MLLVRDLPTMPPMATRVRPFDLHPIWRVCATSRPAGVNSALDCTLMQVSFATDAESYDLLADCAKHNTAR